MRPVTPPCETDAITEASIKISGAMAIVRAFSNFLSVPGEVHVSAALLSDALDGVSRLLESADNELMGT